MDLKKTHKGWPAVIKNIIRGLSMRINSRPIYKNFFLFLAGAFILVFFISAWIWRADIKRNVVYPVMYRIGFMPRAKRITIDIAHKDYQKLAYKRELSLLKGILFSSSDDYVPAKITHGSETFRIKMRLKGDEKNHWVDKNRWSFRIRLKDDKTLFGMRQFSIQQPGQRHFITEWLFHKLLRHSGLINLRYDFIEVIVNGKNLGLYAIEEHFDKLLLENNHYREGPIIRFNDDLYWINRTQEYQSETAYREGFWAGSIDGFHPKRIQKNKELQLQFQKAKNLLESFRREDLKAKQVFNIEKMAMLMAILDLWGNPHAHEYHNIRFYYNPVTSLLEPISYDSDSIAQMASLAGSTEMDNRKQYMSTWENMLFEDKEFFSQYVRALEQISSGHFLNQFFDEIRPEYQKTLKMIYANYPNYIFEEKEYLYQNQGRIRQILNPVKGIQAYFNGLDQKTNTLHLQIGNIQFMPIHIFGVSFDEKKGVSRLDVPLYIEGKIPNHHLEYKTVDIKLKDVLESPDMLSNIKVHYALVGTQREQTAAAYQWPYLQKDFLDKNFMRQDFNFKNFEFLIVKEDTKEILFRRGRWQVKKDIVIPKGFIVVISEGTILDLSHSAKILSYSPVHILGTEEFPVTISSDDSTGQGVLVINAQGQSILQNVIFKNLSAPKHDGWSLTGAVNFYESPVDITRSRFIANRNSDDSLNIIRSEFTIEDTLFQQSFADALDVDFSDGKISNSAFLKCGLDQGGGDGIDFSGSIVEITNTFIDGVSDKGISVWEGSQITAKDIKIHNAKIAVAIKDLSEFSAEGINLANSDIGFALYQKKPEYGPANAVIKNFKYKNLQKSYLLGDESTLIVNEKNIEQESDDNRILSDYLK